MANLSGAVNASVGLWTISADISDDIEFFQVEDEIVEVEANFPSSIYAPTGLITPPKIRVIRAAGGTTAASHASGTTLTPVIPPSAGGGAAEAGTVVAQLTGTQTTYGHLYVGDEDPEVDFGAELQIGDLWVNTTPGPVFGPRTRNETNDGWTVASGVAVDVDTFSGWVIEADGAVVVYFGGSEIRLLANGTISLQSNELGANAAAVTLAADGDVEVSPGGSGSLKVNGSIVGTQAAFVANGSTVDQLRDALIASGLMAAS